MDEIIKVYLELLNNDLLQIYQLLLLKWQSNLDLLKQEKIIIYFTSSNYNQNNTIPLQRYFNTNH